MTPATVRDIAVGAVSVSRGALPPSDRLLCEPAEMNSSACSYVLAWLNLWPAGYKMVETPSSRGENRGGAGRDGLPEYGCPCLWLQRWLNDCALSAGTFT